MWLNIYRFSWLDKNKKAIINHTNKNDKKCIQYAATVTSNYEETGKNPERVTDSKPFKNKYKWE